MRFPHPFRRMGEDHVNIIGAITSTTNDTRKWMEQNFTLQRDLTRSIHPVHVDLNQELADAILAKMHGPLTIPREMGDAFGKFGWSYITPPIGHSKNAPIFVFNVNSDGSFDLRAENSETRELWWQGTFTPVERTNSE